MTSIIYACQIIPYSRVLTQLASNLEFILAECNNVASCGSASTFAEIFVEKASNERLGQKPPRSSRALFIMLRANGVPTLQLSLPTPLFFLFGERKRLQREATNWTILICPPANIESVTTFHGQFTILSPLLHTIPNLEGNFFGYISFQSPEHRGKKSQDAVKPQCGLHSPIICGRQSYHSIHSA